MANAVENSLPPPPRHTTPAMTAATEMREHVIVPSSVERAPDHPAIRRVVIPLDGTAFAEQGREVGVALARAVNADVLLVCCYTERSYLPSGSAALLTAAGGPGVDHSDVAKWERKQHPLHLALTYLEQVQAEIAQPGLTARIEAVQWPPSFAIVRLADRPFSDLVVMATHLGADCSLQPVSGTITREVIEHSRVPVLLLPVNWAAEAAQVRSTGDLGLRKVVAILPQRSGGTGAGTNEPVVARSYAELFARSLGITLHEVHIPLDASHVASLELSTTSSIQEAIPERMGMFIVGGWQRATLALDAERLLRMARAPVLVVPDA